MSSINWDSVGKRVKSVEPLTVYVGSAGSDEKYTLPAGKPSHLISSYIQRVDSKNDTVTYFQVNKNEYIKRTDKTIVVPENEPDESGYFDSAFLGVSDFFSGASTSVKKNVGFLKGGFDETLDRSLFEMLDYAGVGKYVRIGVFSLVFVAILYALTQIKNIVK